MRANCQFIMLLLFIVLLSSVILLDLKKGTIYKLQCQITGKVYIGRTTAEIEKATKRNLVNFKRYNHGTYKTNDRMFEIFAHNNYNVTILEIIHELANETDFPLKLRKLQRFYIKQYVDAVNIVMPSRTLKEYYVENVADIAQQMREYYVDNKETLLQHNKEYRQRVKPLLSQKVTCEICGKQIMKGYLRCHNKTKYHLTAFARLTQKTLPPLSEL